MTRVRRKKDQISVINTDRRWGHVNGGKKKTIESTELSDWNMVQCKETASAETYRHLK